jgi:predicted metalloendopeptidase
MSSRFSAAALTAAALSLAACTHAPSQPSAPAAGQAQIPPGGVDLAARDLTVKPGDDFYRYAGGHRLEGHTIPPDRTRWGSFDELDERSVQQVLSLVQNLPADAPEGTGDQRFFLAFAPIWRSINRDEAMRSQVLSNPHSPPQFRVNGVVRNMDAWYSAFGVQPADKLYLPAAERVRIW